ncbi:hypothetical protein [Vibrio harveyi]|uniref:hypothetical protein n=1 Tax=Vibrio harveyi TaxID=669 RepID=UPI0006817929|nr:hypothetical protein [Vibrio harveyi]
MFQPTDSLLIECTEIATNVTAKVVYMPTAQGEVTSYRYSVTPQPPEQLQVTASSSGVEINCPHFAGFFSPTELILKDLSTNEFHHFKDWADVPQGLKIVSFKPPVGQVVFTLSVTAIFVAIDEITMLPLEPKEFTTSYQIVINPHYSAGQQALLNYGKSNGETG